MKNVNDIKKQVGKLTETDKNKIKGIINALQQLIKGGKVSENGLKLLENIQTSVAVMKNEYTNRMIRLLKQNHMLD